MLRRKAKRIGKKPFKFRFVTTIHSVDFEQGPEWERSGSLVVQWVRHGRNVATDPAARLDDFSGRIHAEWNEPLGMVATLYKDERALAFEEKTYEFRLWETKGSKLSKQLCTATVDFAQYATVTDAQPAQVTADLEPLNKKVLRGKLNLAIRCEPTGDSDSSSNSLYDTMSDASGATFTAEDETALEAGSIAEVEDPASTYQETYLESIQQISATRPKGRRQSTEQLLEKFADEELDGKSADQLRKGCAELRRAIDRERAEHEAVHSALITDYANLKVRLAQAEYDKDRIRLERMRAAQQVAQLKLKLMEQQSLVTRLEARHAASASKR